MELWTLYVVFQLGVGDQRALKYEFKSLELCEQAGKRFLREGSPYVNGYVVRAGCRGPWSTDLHWTPQRPVRPG